jgi:hypothetical protein
LSISSSAVVVARTPFDFAFVAVVVVDLVDVDVFEDGDVSELVFASWVVEVEFISFSGEIVLAVPLAAVEVELTAVIPFEPVATGAVAFFVVSTTVALPPALRVRSSVADASRFKKTLADARPPKASIPKSICMMISQYVACNEYQEQQTVGMT